MKSKMVLCDGVVGQVPRQGAGLGQGLATRAETGGCRKTGELRQGGRREDKGCLGAIVGFREMRTAHAHMATSVYTVSPWHREHVLVSKSHRMGAYGGGIHHFGGVGGCPPHPVWLHLMVTAYMSHVFCKVAEPDYTEEGFSDADKHSASELDMYTKFSEGEREGWPVPEETRGPHSS